MIHGVAEKKFLKIFENLKYGSLRMTLPDGKVYNFTGREAGPDAEIRIYDKSFVLNLYARGDIGFADDYRNGKWDTEDLVALIEFCLLNEEALDDCIFGSGFFRALVKFSYIFKNNTINGSKKNIYAHYDIGNEFYSLWLDDSMSYSSAIYKDKAEPLLQAQYNKYDRILERIGDQPSNILEIGCGWGGFMERGINKGHNIKGLTISEEQFDYARERIAKLGDTSSAVALEDYRIQKGKFSHIVSIEMFEAVGEKYWKPYFDKLAQLLDNKGKAVIQTITIDDRYFEKYRKGGDFIRSYIFPGGMLPAENIFAAKAAEAGLKITDQFRFGHDYATTLKNWLHNFDAKINEVKAMGFDSKFIRIWRYYLAACAASFAVGRTNVMQAELQHA